MKITNNKGFSLVEVIIIIAIISIIVGSASYGVSMISGKPAIECANKLASELQHLRVISMGKNKVEIVIKKDSSGRLTIDEKITVKAGDTPTSVTSLVGKEGVEVYYSTDKSTWKEITSGDVINLEFSRSNGSLKPIDSTKPENEWQYYEYFKISKGNTQRFIFIEPLTGKVKVLDTL